MQRTGRASPARSTCYRRTLAQVIEVGIPQQIALIASAQNCAHGNDERRTAPKDPPNMNVSAYNKALDKNLEDTFPASDPVFVLQSPTAAPTVSPQRTLS